MKKLALILVLSALAGCSGSTKSGSAVPVVANVKLPVLPADLRDCPRPVSIQQSIGSAEAVGESKIIELWTRDRATAVRCRNRLLQLGSYYEKTREDVSRISSSY